MRAPPWITVSLPHTELDSSLLPTVLFMASPLDGHMYLVCHTMILSEEQIVELHSRLKFTTVPNWKALPGLSSQIATLKTLLSDVFLRKHNEAYLEWHGVRVSALLLGPGGCCKHLLLDFCLHALEEENSSASPSADSPRVSSSCVSRLFPIDPFSKGEYIRINLDGDYIESDDDAFRVIARQLTAPVMRRRMCVRCVK